MEQEPDLNSNLHITVPVLELKQCQGLIIIHEKTLKKIHQQKTLFALTIPVMFLPSFLNRHEYLFDLDLR